MNNRISIRTAIILPFLIVILAILLILTFMIRDSYETLALDQGGKLISSISLTADDKLANLLERPQLVNSFFSDLIEKNVYYEDEDYTVLEPLTLNLIKNVAGDLPQISSIGYGDRYKHFLGVRVNGDETYTLMVKDALTDEMLNIYAGETRSTEILTAFENYDPTTRPWYAPVIKNPVAQWSDVYVNYDEIQNTTITSIVPILDKNDQVASVTGIDVSLNGINTFLSDITKNNAGIVYLVDKEFKVIAHSTDELLVNVLETDPPTTEFSYGYESTNALIADSSLYFKENFDVNQVKTLQADGQTYYTMLSSIKADIGLDWYIVVAITEEDLIGNIKSQFNLMRTTMLILGVIGLFIGSILISIFISSVTKMAKVVESVNVTTLDDLNFEDRHLNFKEVSKLQRAYEKMMSELSSSFDKLSRSEKRYRGLIESSEALIFSMSPDGKLLTYNKKVLNYTHLSEEAIKDKTFFDLFDNPADQALWRNNIVTILSSQEAFDGYHEYLDNGIRVVFKIKIYPIIDQQEVKTLICTFVDIAELVNAQEEVEKLLSKEKEELEILVKERTTDLEMAMEELIQKEKLASLGSLVSGISHEINTPLGVAVSASSYLKTTALKNKDKLLEGKLTKTEFVDFVDKIEDSVVIIENNLLRANDLIRSFKQISVNKTYEETVHFSLYDYANATIKSLNHELKVNKHQLDLTCEPSINLYGNPGSFSQILTNLILNSITHAYEDEQGHISIDITDHDDHVMMVYKDDGKGIEQEIIHKIFDPFFTTNRKQGGSGLGLNIVYNIITGQFNGTITVDSDRGTTFTIRFPKGQEVQ